MSTPQMMRKVPSLEPPDESESGLCHSPRPCPELAFPPQYMEAVRASLDGNYSVSDPLGEGISGTVKVAMHRETGKQVAIKTILKESLNGTQLLRVQREYGLMKYASHPNLIRLVEVIENPEEINIVMELAEGGDLYSYILSEGRPLEELHAGQLFIQIADAVCYLHKIGFIHRDIKPENILLDRTCEIPILADLGYSAPYTDHTKTIARCGSMYYAAPEVMAKKEYTGPEVDVWSLGVLLYVMVLGRLPFHGATDDDTLRLIAKGSFDERGLPPLLRDLIRHMINPDQRARYTIVQVLEHSWLEACATELGWIAEEENDESECIRDIFIGCKTGSVGALETDEAHATAD